MNNLDFVQRLINIAAEKTIYVCGGWGQLMSEYNKQMFSAKYAKNRENQTIASGIKNATAATRGFDCIGYICSVINNSVGKWSNSPMRNVPIKEMLADCSDVSSDMSNIQPGELLVYGDYSHCGVYVGVVNGKRTAAECTFRWSNGCQLVDIDREERKAMWKYHGKLSKYIEYLPYSAAASDLVALGDSYLCAKKGQRSDYVLAIQKVLKEKKLYDDALDGIFGGNTEKAIKAVQRAAQLKETGIVDTYTYIALIEREV